MNARNPVLSTLGALGVAVLMAPITVHAADAYWVNSDGTIWRNSSGECWRTQFWTETQALPECEGGPVPAAVAAVPPPAPEPKDSDGDGIVDSADACPGTAAGVRVDARGCALQERIELKGVNFTTGSAELTPSSAGTLDAVADALRRYPEMRVEIQGHTDSQGNRDFNTRLSQQRADAVRMYLLNKGIAASRLSARGFGPDQPVAGNDTAAGRAQNRRVELVILE